MNRIISIQAFITFAREILTFDKNAEFYVLHIEINCGERNESICNIVEVDENTPICVRESERRGKIGYPKLLTIVNKLEKQYLKTRDIIEENAFGPSDLYVQFNNGEFTNYTVSEIKLNGSMSFTMNEIGQYVPKKNVKCFLEIFDIV